MDKFNYDSDSNSDNLENQNSSDNSNCGWGSDGNWNSSNNSNQNMNNMNQGFNQNSNDMNQGFNQNSNGMNQNFNQNMNGMNQGFNQNMNGMNQNFNQNMNGMNQSFNQNMNSMNQGFNQNMNGMNQGYNQNMYGMNGYNPYNNFNQNPNSQKKGKAIASLILGIISLSLCCVIGWLPGIIAIILSAIALKKQEGGKGVAIGGLICGIIGTLFGGYMTLSFAVMMSNPAMKEQFWTSYVEAYNNALEAQGYGDEYKLPDDFMGANGGSSTEVEIQEPIEDSSEDSSENSSDSSSNKSDSGIVWPSVAYGGDDSTCYFSDDGTYMWYQDEYADVPNYKSGTYKIYFGQEALDKITNEYTEAGLTEDEVTGLFHDENSLDNLTLITMTVDELYYEGEYSDKVPYDKQYYGFTNASAFSGADMNEASFFIFYFK